MKPVSHGHLPKVSIPRAHNWNGWSRAIPIRIGSVYLNSKWDKIVAVGSLRGSHSLEI